MEKQKNKIIENVKTVIGHKSAARELARKTIDDKVEGVGF